MSLRIKTLEDFNKLGKNAKTQVKALIPRASFSAGGNKGHTPRVVTNSDGLKCCPWPPKDPAVHLHQMLLKHFGAVGSGIGCIASEVIIPGSDVRYRYDFLITTAKIVIEFDGYRAHFSKVAFQNDREKQYHAHANGYLLHRVTNRDVRNGEALVIARINRLIAQRGQYSIKLRPVGFTQCEVIASKQSYRFTG